MLGPWLGDACNPIKPDWLVCRLTPAGYRVLGGEPPAAPTTPPGAEQA
jgi:hypothetical protein